MSDLFKSALSYIGSSSSSTSRSAGSSNGAPPAAPSIPAPLTEVIKLSGENVRLLKLLAEGGCSYVYGGQFGPACEIIAVKKIPCQADMEDRILSEIKYMNGFQHINIAKYYGYNKVNNTYWIGLEYCSSLRLPVPIDQVGLVFGHIVSGVEYMHKKGITHWDLKIENCMLGRDQMIKLIDFGSANTEAYDTTNLSAKERNIMEDELMRFTTPMYRPPEILDLWSGLRIDQHVDLWALGCIIYYLAHSEHPFSDSNKLAIINCKYAKKPSVFSKIIEGLLVINPEGRWTLGGVLHELQSMGVDVTAQVPMYFEEFQMPLQHAIAANVQSSSLLNSIKGGAESLFKNIKESSTRIYANSGSSGRPEQASVERENPMAQQRPPPPRPAPPRSPVPRRPPPAQLTGEREVDEGELVPPPRPAPPRSQPATAFDLISDIESSEPETTSEGAGTLLEEASGTASVDLLGEFKSDIDLLAGTGSAAGYSSGRRASGPTKANDLDDLFGFSPMPTSNVKLTTQIPVIGAEKVDLFGSLMSDVSSEKTPVLPTSSSFNHLGAYKEENRKDEMVKSTPNLNDIFSDLLSGEGLKPTPVQPVKMSNGGGGLSGQTTPNNPTIGGFANFGNVPVMPTGPRFTPPNRPPAMGGMSSGPRPTFSASGGAATSGANYRPSWTSDMPSVFGPDKSGIGASELKVGGKKIDLNEAFGQLLNEQGFTGSSAQSAGSKTLKDMRRTEIAQSKTPEQMKVMDWVEGKRKNIRALLSSLHTVTWEGCTWKPANMSLMVEPNDVKKVYRRACLAIHPDKQRGEDCEELAKLIFVELNEAYTHFESELR